MSIRATSPYTIYLDANGLPLTSGYVYFGVAGSNPETVPIAIYWDEALAIPAAQPLRTINGFIVRNGSPGTIYTAAAYSVTVKNKNGALVFSALTNPGIPFSLAMLPVCSAATLAAGLTAFGFSAFVQTLINDADAAAFFTTLGISAFIQTLLNDADAATARATLGAVGLTGAEAVAGVKTFSDGIVSDVTGDLTGNADEADGVRETGTGASLLKCKVIEIGDWDMDATAAVNIAHGLTVANIRSVAVVVRGDSDAFANYFSAPRSNLLFDGSAGTEVDLDFEILDNGNIRIDRRTGGFFDGANFNAAGWNRGWITIWYAA